MDEEENEEEANDRWNFSRRVHQVDGWRMLLVFTNETDANIDA